MHRLFARAGSSRVGGLFCVSRLERASKLRKMRGFVGVPSTVGPGPVVRGFGPFALRPADPIPGFVFVAATSVEHVKSDNTVKLKVPSSLAGNCLIIWFQSGTLPTADPTAVDNTGSGTWGVAKGVVGNQRMTALVKMNSAAGVNRITVTMQATETFVSLVYAEAYNCLGLTLAAALDGTPSGTTGIVGSPVAAGNLTTAFANSVVFQFGVSAGTLADSVYSPGAGWTSLAKQRSSQVGSAPTYYVQYQVLTKPGTINPTYTFTQTGSPTSDTLAFALRAGMAGTPPPPGMHTICSLGCNVVAAQTSVTLDFVNLGGNLIHIWAEGSDFHVTGIIDADGNSYVGDDGTIPGLAVGNDSWRAINVTPNTELKTIVITWGGSNAQPGFIQILGVMGTNATQGTKNRVQTVTNSGIQSPSSGNVDFFTAFQVLTPDGMCFINFQIETHTVDDMIAPTPANGGCANIPVMPSADGAGTTFAEDNLHAFWDYAGLPGPQTFTATINNNTAGVNHWGATITEYKAAGVVGGGTTFTQALTAALSYVGAFTKRTSTARAAALSFVGAIAKRAGKALAGALSFAGASAKLTSTVRTAALSFVGALVKRTATARTAALSFVGALAASKLFVRALTATLSFAGAQTGRASKALSGALSFIGASVKSTGTARAGAVSFIGSTVKRTSTARTAVLSFVGAFLTGSLFKNALTGALSFVGAIATSRVTLKALTGALSFVGAFVRSSGKSLSGTLSFAGAARLKTSRILAGALNFAGSTGKRFPKAVAGALSFIGAMVTHGGLIQVFLSATLGFVGSMGAGWFGRKSSQQLRASPPARRLGDVVEAVKTARLGEPTETADPKRLGSANTKPPGNGLGS